MGVCNSANALTTADYLNPSKEEKNEKEPKPPDILDDTIRLHHKEKQKITIHVVQGNNIHTNVVLHILDYDHADIYIHFVEYINADNQDFIILVNNGSRTQNKTSASRLPKNKRIYELACLPVEFEHFKNYVFLFTRMYLIEMSRASHKKIE